MKTYLQLSINEKINAKGNCENRGSIYGIKPKNWYAMLSCQWIFDGMPTIYDAVYDYMRKIHYGFNN